MVKRVTPEQQKAIVDKIKKEYEDRKRSPFRLAAEKRWERVDKLIAMEEPYELKKDEDKWRSNLPTGELAEASEVITADVIRLLFPASRRSFAAHVDVSPELVDENDEVDVKQNADKEMEINETLESLMEQQHSDQGLTERVKLSIKEALHHGSFVVEADTETISLFFGAKVRDIKIPVWKPYSMWDCFPDPSENVIGTNLFYKGSMIIRRELPANTIDSQKWINKKEILDNDDKKIEIIKYFGDITIKPKNKPRTFNNMVIIVANGVLASFLPNELPHSRIIFSGYERDNVKNPYYTSPIVKVAPNAVAATESFNKFNDLVALHTEPPLVFDSLDPAFAKTGGPVVRPGAKIPSQGNAAFKEIKVGDPGIALEGYRLQVEKIQSATGSDETRAGVSSSAELTAFEVSKKDQKGEIRTVNFVGVVEKQGFRPFLYMQHELNKLHLQKYSFYNTFTGADDFAVRSKEDLNKFAKDARFEVTGSRDVLGEEQRKEGLVTASERGMKDPEINAMMDKRKIMEDVYKDSGVKQPERYFKKAKDLEDPRISEMQQQMQEMQKELEKFNLIDERHQLEVAKKELEIRSVKGENSNLEEQIQLERKKNIVQREELELEHLREIDAVEDSVEVQQ